MANTEVIKLCNEIDCTGCEACRSVCPTESIQMLPVGNLLAEVPRIDNKTCIKCHACEHTCPVLHPLILQLPKKSIAAIAIDSHVNHTSTSGGIAAIISDQCVKNGGVVYGAVSKGRDVFHKRCTTQNDLKDLRGSKYVKSYLKDSYLEAKTDLKNNKKVIFFGTPCQIAGLKSFLKREYENLITVDLICHGTPSQELLKRHLKNIVGSQKVTRISFREEGYKMRIYNEHEVIYENNLWKQRFKDAYYSAFYIACSTFRDSCYHCKYAGSARVSDITIGDFWGLDKSVVFSRKPSGISLVLPVTEKGEGVINSLQDELEMHERPLKEAFMGNSQLRRPSKLNFAAKLFRKLFSVGFSMKAALNMAYLPALPLYYLKNKLTK